MNQAQRATLKTAIQGDANLTAFLASGDTGSIAAYYNTVPGSPTTVWRPNISTAELNTAILWSEFTTLTTQFQASYQAMIAPGFIDATSVNIRSGFGTIFAGKTSLTNLTALAQRNATRLEAMFAVSNVTPVFGQTVQPADIVLALAGG